jgi:hypothetical protein
MSGSTRMVGWCEGVSTCILLGCPVTSAYVQPLRSKLSVGPDWKIVQ